MTQSSITFNGRLRHLTSKRACSSDQVSDSLSVQYFQRQGILLSSLFELFIIPPMMNPSRWQGSNQEQIHMVHSAKYSLTWLNAVKTSPCSGSRNLCHQVQGRHPTSGSTARNHSVLLLPELGTWQATNLFSSSRCSTQRL